jgi:hypothetical protein
METPPPRTGLSILKEEGRLPVLGKRGAVDDTNTTTTSIGDDDEVVWRTGEWTDKKVRRWKLPEGVLLLREPPKSRYLLPFPL